MRIGVIGAGFIGQAFARQVIAAGHDVMISNSRGPQTLSSIPPKIGAQIGTLHEAIGFGEIILIAIPFHQYATLPVEPLRDKIVLDANNYYPDRDGSIPELDERRATTSGLLAQHLTGSRLVKAFNAILASDLEKGGQTLPSGRRASQGWCDSSASTLSMLGRWRKAGVLSAPNQLTVYRLIGKGCVRRSMRLNATLICRKGHGVGERQIMRKLAVY